MMVVVVMVLTVNKGMNGMKMEQFAAQSPAVRLFDIPTPGVCPHSNHGGYDQSILYYDYAW